MPAKTEKKKKKCNSVKKVKSTVKSEVKFGVKSKVIKISEKTGSKRNVSKKKVKRIQYAPEDLKKAVLDVEKGMSYRKTSNKYGVPVTSIHRAMKNQDQASKKSGPPTVLSPNEESDIVQWILYRAERGYPISKTELLDAVRKYVTLLDKKTPFTNRRPGRRWYESFRKRHNNISLRTPQHLTLTRASVTEEDLRDWFREIEEYLRKKGLIDIQPSRVFNCDETNMQLIPKSEKVLTEIGARSAYKIVDGFEKESVTALFMYSADGSRAPPMLMFKYKDSVPKSISKNCPVDWGIGISENGWMTTETFYEYIANIFYPWLLKENIEFPVIIYLDGHSSHVTIPLVKFCRENRIELIALFPNATHILQPLDIALFHPFKDLWRKTVLKWKAENNQSRLKKEHVSKVLAETLACFTNEKKIIQGGFQAAGLMPFNPNAIEYNILNKKKKKKVKKQEDEPESQQAVTVAQTETKSQHMQNLEQNLPHELLQAFREAEQIGFWTRDVENIGLFNYWFKQKQATSASNHYTFMII
ncbi:uncharacterized protein [Prorops nasuta]|uniref:uncharacterized protein n=1 Tax=Prorops nasuta TaxID=863751 RepID=UPI0034CD44BB